MTTDSGYLLWQGNNAGIFTYYPSQSIDISARHALAALSPKKRALAYMREDPWRTMQSAARKLNAAFS